MILIHAVRVFDDEEANNTPWNAILRKNALQYHSEIDQLIIASTLENRSNRHLKDLTIPVVIVGLKKLHRR